MSTPHHHPHLRTATPSSLSFRPPSSVGNLSSSHLRSTYLQHFRLISPHDGIHTPMASGSLTNLQDRHRPPLLEPTILYSNTIARQRAHKQAIRERAKNAQKRQMEREQEARRIHHHPDHQDYHLQHPYPHSPQPPPSSSSPSHRPQTQSSMRTQIQSPRTRAHYQSPSTPSFAHTQPLPMMMHYQNTTPSSNAYQPHQSFLSEPDDSICPFDPAYAHLRPYTSPSIGSSSYVDDSNNGAVVGNHDVFGGNIGGIGLFPSEFEEKDGGVRDLNGSESLHQHPATVTPSSLPPLRNVGGQQQQQQQQHQRHHSISQRNDAAGGVIVNGASIDSNQLVSTTHRNDSSSPVNASPSSQVVAGGASSPNPSSSSTPSSTLSSRPSDVWMIRRTNVPTPSSLKDTSSHKSYTLRKTPNHDLYDLSFPPTLPERAATSSSLSHLSTSSSNLYRHTPNGVPSTPTSSSASANGTGAPSGPVCYTDPLPTNSTAAADEQSRLLAEALEQVHARQAREKELASNKTIAKIGSRLAGTNKSVLLPSHSSSSTSSTSSSSVSTTLPPVTNLVTIFDAIDLQGPVEEDELEQVEQATRAARAQQQQQPQQQHDNGSNNDPSSFSSSDELPQGFPPATEDVMDLYFFLTDSSCPIFRTNSSSSSYLTSMKPTSTIPFMPNAPPLSPVLAASAMTAKRIWGNAYATSAPSTTSQRQDVEKEDDEDYRLYSYSNTSIDGMGRKRFLPSPGFSHLAERVGMDLPRLTALTEAAGGSVANALGYCDQLCPSVLGGHATGSGIGGGGGGASRSFAHFDPFHSMEELIHTVRGMYQRDLQAGIPPPTLRHANGSKHHGHTRSITSPAPSSSSSIPSILHDSSIDLPPAPPTPPSPTLPQWTLQPRTFTPTHAQPTYYRPAPSQTIMPNEVGVASTADAEREEAQAARLIARDLLGFGFDKTNNRT